MPNLQESKFTGISIHNVNENFDSGSIILKKKILLQIKNPIKLNIKLSSIAANMIKKLLNKKISPVNSIKFKKKTEYYKKWNWLGQKFFLCKKKKIITIWKILLKLHTIFQIILTGLT